VTVPTTPEAMLEDPWGTLRLVVGDPLHPGGEDATEALLDRAGVDAGTRLLEVGCGAGGALSLAADRGAAAVGLDRDPAAGPAVRGDLGRLPVAGGAVDVVLAECVLCLADDVDRALAEAARALGPGGRLAVSDVTVEGSLPAVPEELAEALCLAGPRSREGLLDRVEAAGFDLEDVEDHHDDLLAMRDRADERVDYAGLLAAMGERGRALADGVAALEAAVERGDVGYVSLVATAG